MRRDNIIAKLKQAEPALRRAGVEAPFLFDSTARDEGRPDSDIDVFIDQKSDEEFGFLQYMDAYQTIRDAVGSATDIGYSMRAGLSRYVGAGIERVAIRVF
ncbi:MAG TPA: nucleotidyltransferase domain-containing protein [Methyloceanibacter sp.]|jgi:predicted nucleotidyltransferase|nr:nucleotidyltransferase domain-containing protein [Methyloceanibacter sp.]